MIELSSLLIYLGRLILATGLGLFIGYERENQNKPAGLRDISLVTIGAALFAIIALELVNIVPERPDIRYDIGRIIAYSIVSIGFLGSGVIVQIKNKLEGITTAGVLWSMVATGLLCGIGQYILAVIASIFIYFILKLKYIRIKFEGRKKKCKMS